MGIFDKYERQIESDYVTSILSTAVTTTTPTGAWQVDLPANEAAGEITVITPDRGRSLERLREEFYRVWSKERKCKVPYLYRLRWLQQHYRKSELVRPLK